MPLMFFLFVVQRVYYGAVAVGLLVIARKIRLVIRFKLWSAAPLFNMVDLLKCNVKMNADFL